jgi:hypothetical protein
MKIRILFLTVCSLGFVQNTYAQTSTYTPPPMFGNAPVTAPVNAPVDTIVQQPQTSAPSVTPTIPPQQRVPTQQTPTQPPKQNNVGATLEPISEDDLYGDGTIKHSIPLPILSTPNSETQRQNAIKQQRAREEARKRAIEEEKKAKREMERQERELKKLYGAAIPTVNAETLLDFPVTNDGDANSPLSASDLAKSKLPQPKEGEKIDDTGVPESKIWRPEPLPKKPPSAVIKKIEAKKDAQVVEIIRDEPNQTAKTDANPNVTPTLPITPPKELKTP